MIEIVRHHARRVKHWEHGKMALRWTAAGMLTAATADQPGTDHMPTAVTA
jgi:hypothetical protein